MQRALFIGRFQPFHNAHLQDAREILKKHDEIIVGIGSSQKKNTFENPFSYNERKNMIKAVFKKNRINKYSIFRIPDLYNDKKWVGYIKTRLPKFDIAYSGNEWTLKCFRKHSIRCTKIKLKKGTSSTIIRNNILNDKKWEHLVPKEISRYIHKINGVKRIKKLA